MSTSVRSALIVLALSASLHETFIVHQTSRMQYCLSAPHPPKQESERWKFEQQQYIPLGLFELELAGERCVLHCKTNQQRVVAGVRKVCADFNFAGTIAHEHILRTRTWIAYPSSPYPLPRDANATCTTTTDTAHGSCGSCGLCPKKDF